MCFDPENRFPNNQIQKMDDTKDGVQSNHLKSDPLQC